MVVRGSVEQSRERLVALVLLLQRAHQYGALSQEEILRELTVDEFPVSAKGPRKVRAYEGADATVRQKFERDKARIRDLGFVIETVERDDGSVGYRVDPASGYAPPLYFNDREARVVALALRFCGFGQSGAFSVFSETPATDGALAASNYYTPVVRALKLRRVLSFEYYSSTRKIRVVEPLVVDVVRGVAYLVARVRGTEEIKGYRFSRMTSMPEVLADTFSVDDETLENARAWRPEYQKSPRPLDVVVSTSADYAELLVRQYPGALTAQKRNRVEVGITFDGPGSALRFALDAADRVRVEAPKSLRDDLATWLRGVNRGDAPPLDDIVFPPQGGQDVLGQTLRLLHAVYASDGGLRVSELARRFGLEPDHVRLIMDRLVSLEPMNATTDGTGRFPAHVIKECDDWDDEAHDDSLYLADFSDLPEGAPEPSALMWRDLFELNLALHEAARVYHDDALTSAMRKIEDVTSSFLHVESNDVDDSLVTIERAVRDGAQLKIEYVAVESDEVQVRLISPREIRVLNGHTYVRAYCDTRRDWRTFRLDRVTAVLATSPGVPTPPDTVEGWLTRVGDDGGEVVVVLEPPNRWHFETLPGAQWSTVRDGRLAVKFHVTSASFLDHLMVKCGPGAVVATPAYRRAGHELAKRMLAAL
ncbi:MAG: WYL domain-containing protein [Acidobacteriota bacterium]|nr:WYL domain-containing protein [Acidobacteriota bacterium]MDE3043462.1 WYL domain-containing protein [Acidobacteriota bacterium]MDE3107261.1 WYL domain-containing protein [Acidobacteriota bacterium]MDE3223631.1 WYL domain-containing protein [Acidobacteriota bacterium]